MQLLATGQTGPNAKVADLLTILLGAKTPKAAGFPMLLQKKVVEESGSAGGTSVNRVADTNGDKKRSPKPEAKSVDQRVTGPELLLAMQTPVVSVAKVEFSWPAQLVLQDCGDAGGAEESSPLEIAPAGEVRGVPKNVEITQPERLIEVLRPQAKEVAVQPTKDTPSSSDGETRTSDDHVPVEPLPTGAEKEEKTSTAAVTSEQLPQKIVTFAMDVPADPAPQTQNREAAVTAVILGNGKNEGEAPGRAVSEHRNTSSDEHPLHGKSNVNGPTMSSPRTGDPPETRANGIDAISGSKKAAIEAEKPVSKAVHGSPFASTPFGMRWQEVAPQGSGEAVSDMRSAGNGDAAKHRTTELQNFPAQAPVAFHSLRLTEHMAGPELHFNWRSPDAGDIQLSTTLHHREVQMIVNTEKPDTAAAMRAELPSLDSRLHEHSLRLGEVNIVAQERGISTGLGMSGHDRGQREWNVPLPLTCSMGEPIPETKIESLPAIMPLDGRVSVLA